ncbi:glycosyl transferase [Nostoc sp. PCC 7524]|uniref:glycosyltransferase n=1 Tax=Nostoc sp. (strain ATCC 29411 / PCC 7524) TaxID=28072 RepID=UPI00029F1703|nr:glycosyltransferase [Nostoc sp. PCC 7524]AFY50940.1 glycosyl transferase [Nostoc sp. PCC 7524]
MTLISIILPVYNGEKTIKETIQSILHQSFIDWELIVINDGSQDTTLDIINEFADHRLHVYSFYNAGLAISRNRGIIKSKGDYIAFLDADDLWTPDKLACQFKALQENPQASVAYSWCNHIDESSHFLRNGSRISANGDVYAKLLVGNFLENGSNPLIRRQALLSVGEFEPSLNPAEDWDLWLRLASSYHFVLVPFPHVLYRVTSNSMSSNIVKMEAASLKIIEKAFNHAPQSLQSLKNYSIGNLYKYLIYKLLESSSPDKFLNLSIKFLCMIAKYDVSIIRTKAFIKLLFKIIVINLMAQNNYFQFLETTKNNLNTSTILAYVKYGEI